jgi:hypothetical protein
LGKVFTIDDYANAVIEFIKETLKEGSVILWGHSN